MTFRRVLEFVRTILLREGTVHTLSTSKILARTIMTAGGRVINLLDYGVGRTLSDVQHTREWNSLVSMACHSLQQHNIIALPTDTIYGIGALAQSSEAIGKIYGIKKRDRHKPISICVGDVEDVYRWGNVTISKALLSELLPGPVTVVFERTGELNPSLNPGTALVGIRVPDYGFVCDVARQCKEPLALTSANVSNAPSTVNIEEFEDLWPQLDLVFDGGRVGSTAKSRLGSTVVDLSVPAQFTVIRPGSARQSTVEKLLQHGLTERDKDQ